MNLGRILIFLTFLLEITKNCLSLGPEKMTVQWKKICLMSLITQAFTHAIAPPPPGPIAFVIVWVIFG